MYHHRIVTYDFDIPGSQHYRVCDVQCSIGMSKRQSTVGVPGANIGIKVRRVKRGRVCFCILAAESTSVLIYILNTVHTVAFVSLLKISELYIISKSFGGPYIKHIITAHVLQQTIPYRLYNYCCTDAGVPGATKPGV